VDANGMPVRAIITADTTADSTQAIPLINGFMAECLLADRAYDSNAILEHLMQAGMQIVIPPKKP